MNRRAAIGACALAALAWGALRCTAPASTEDAGGGSDASGGGAGGGSGGGSDAATGGGSDAATDAATDASTDAGPGSTDAAVDPSTLDRKFLLGYQGWFLCAGDDAGLGWVHWFRPGDAGLLVDFWPDTRELAPSEKCVTPYTLADGGPAYVFSAQNPATVARHFEWMRDAGVDGVMLQRFTVEIVGGSRIHVARNRVAANVRAGAEATGRVFAIMYDLSGPQDAGEINSTIESDWQELVDTLTLTASPTYQRHAGRPVVAIWGFGYADGNHHETPQAAAELISWFHQNPTARYRATVMVGVPRTWLKGGDAGWLSAIRSADVVSPWNVGSYRNFADIDSWANGDLKAMVNDADANGYAFMPVVFPGFSWLNLNGGPLNQIPRDGGAFLWRQIYVDLAAGAPMLYGAMFDEVNEGTAMFKTAETAADEPAALQGVLVPLDADGVAVKNDFYLRLIGEGSRELRREAPLSPQLPLAP